MGNTRPNTPNNPQKRVTTNIFEKIHLILSSFFLRSTGVKIPLMKHNLSRRDFLKLSLVSLSSLAFRPWFGRDESRQPSLIGRVTIDQIDVRVEPNDTSAIIGQRFRDQLISLYYVVESPEGPAWNPTWYRVWGGYVHSAYIQLVKVRLNDVFETMPEHGQLCEVTVPITTAFTYDRFDGWKQVYALYYETTHWVTGVEEGPDGKPWYQVTSELDKYLNYLVPSVHLRPIPDREIAPIAPDVPYQAKRIEVDLSRQTLTAIQEDEIVFQTKVSTGLPSRLDIPDGTRTTIGDFHVVSKSPSKHMGALQTSGAPGSYVLPGVPWTTFFVFEYGVAFHGTYWHNNFGVPMSHGCVNMRNDDAKWLFRWVTPLWEIPTEDHTAWDRRGFGTIVRVF